MGGVTFGKDIRPQRTPRSTSSRLVSCVYSFLALILINSYCANLTAFLVKEKVDLPISGIDDPRVRFYNCDLFNRQYHDSLNDWLVRYGQPKSLIWVAAWLTDWSTERVTKSQSLHPCHRLTLNLLTAICRCHSEDSTFSSVILRPSVLIWSGTWNFDLSHGSWALFNFPSGFNLGHSARKKIN